MPIDVTWLIEGRVMNLRFRGNVTLEDIQEGNAITLKMMDVGDAPLIHSVQDATELTSLPISFRALGEAAGSSYRHPRLGWVVAHSVQNRVLSFIGDMMGRLFQTRYRIFDTRAEALTFLNSVDQTLPSLDEFVSQIYENKPNP